MAVVAPARRNRDMTLFGHDTLGLASDERIIMTSIHKEKLEHEGVMPIFHISPSMVSVLRS